MKNWTDTCINWNQLPATEVKRLIATWGFTPEKIAQYDKKHGFDTVKAKPVTPQVPALKGMTPLGIKPAAKTVTVTVKKSELKKPVQSKNTASKADSVRSMIAAGLTEDQVINQCVNDLGMSAGLAKTYYKNNLNKVAVGA